MVPRTSANAARRSESSRRAVLAAALDQLAEVGYAKLSIEGIAAAAGVGKQTIYRWWPSKGAVLLDSLLALSEGQDGQVMGLPDSGDLEADLKLVLRATVDEFNDPRVDGPMRALTAEIQSDPALAAASTERLDEPLKALKRQRLRSAQVSGELPPELDLDLAIDLIWGPLTSRWLQRSGPLTHAYADQTVERALNGLRAPVDP